MQRTSSNAGALEFQGNTPSQGQPSQAPTLHTATLAMDGAATHRDPHAGILRLSKEDAARAPPVRAQGPALGDKDLGLQEEANVVVTAARLAVKRLLGVTCLVASNTSTSQSKGVTAALNVVCFLQVCMLGGDGVLRGQEGNALVRRCGSSLFVWVHWVDLIP